MQQGVGYGIGSGHTSSIKYFTGRLETGQNWDRKQNLERKYIWEFFCRKRK